MCSCLLRICQQLRFLYLKHVYILNLIIYYINIVLFTNNYNRVAHSRVRHIFSMKFCFNCFKTLINNMYLLNIINNSHTYTIVYYSTIAYYIISYRDSDISNIGKQM